MPDLRKKLIRLAHGRREMRPHLLPLLRESKIVPPDLDPLLKILDANQKKMLSKTSLWEALKLLNEAFKKKTRSLGFQVFLMPTASGKTPVPKAAYRVFQQIPKGIGVIAHRVIQVEVSATFELTPSTWGALRKSFAGTVGHELIHIRQEELGGDKAFGKQIHPSQKQQYLAQKHEITAFSREIAQDLLDAGILDVTPQTMARAALQSNRLAEYLALFDPGVGADRRVLRRLLKLVVEWLSHPEILYHS